MILYVFYLVTTPLLTYLVLIVKEWVYLHFVMARSTPKKGPLRVYGLIDVSGSIPLFRSI